MDTLPSEIWCNIFPFLSFSEFLQFPETCHHSHALCQQPIHWNIVNCGNYNYNEINHIIKSGNRFKNPKNLYIIQTKTQHNCLFIPDTFRNRFLHSRFIFV